MRIIQSKTEEMAIVTAQSLVSWLDELLTISSDNRSGGNNVLVDQCDQISDACANAKFILSMLELYKKEIYNCDITIAQLKIENDKFEKIKKIANS
jgi:hypothetical protein